MLQQPKAEDFVIATGIQESVRTFIELTAIELGWGGISWDGTEVNEIGRRKDSGDIVVKIDPRYFRPAEVETLLGDPTKAKERLGWKPKISLIELIREMVTSDRENASKEALLKREGFNVVSSMESPPTLRV
jgi:GDPmannose 4,6-dehydratase